MNDKTEQLSHVNWHPSAFFVSPLRSNSQRKRFAKVLQYIKPSNRRARILVGLLLAGLFFIQFTSAETFRNPAVKAISIVVPDSEIEDMARNDHILLLEKCLASCNSINDFTCTFIKTERINGIVKGEQRMGVKFLSSPFSVAMKWKSHDLEGRELFIPMADTVVYVEGKYNGNMLARPRSGFLRKLCPVARRRPDGPDVMRNTLSPISVFGFARSIKSLLDVYTQADQAGDLVQKFGGYAEVEGRKAIILVRYLPQKKNYPAWETKTYIDIERLVPIMIEGKGWDRQIHCRYIYKDIKFNAGLKESDFLPENNGMNKQSK